MKKCRLCAAVLQRKIADIIFDNEKLDEEKSADMRKVSKAS